jgi:hypothetical protein
VNVKGLEKCCISNGIGGGLTMICYGMAVKRRGMSEVSVRKRKTLTMKMGTVTLIAKGS